MDDSQGARSAVDRLLERQNETRTLSYVYLAVAFMLGVAIFLAKPGWPGSVTGLLALSAAVMFVNYSMAGHADQVMASVAQDARREVAALERRVAALEAVSKADEVPATAEARAEGAES